MALIIVQLIKQSNHAENLGAWRYKVHKGYYPLRRKNGLYFLDLLKSEMRENRKSDLLYK